MKWCARQVWVVRQFSWTVMIAPIICKVRLRNSAKMLNLFSHSCIKHDNTVTIKLNSPIVSISLGQQRVLCIIRNKTTKRALCSCEQWHNDPHVWHCATTLHVRGSKSCRQVKGEGLARRINVTIRRQFVWFEDQQNIMRKTINNENLKTMMTFYQGWRSRYSGFFGARCPPPAMSGWEAPGSSNRFPVYTSFFFCYCVFTNQCGNWELTIGNWQEGIQCEKPRKTAKKKNPEWWYQAIFHFITKSLTCISSILCLPREKYERNKNHLE